jgi:hypothetical protein
VLSDFEKKQVFFLSTIARFIFDASVKGYQLTCGEFWRSPETCSLYEKQGKGILHSNHEKRLAADINVFYQDRLLTSKEDYEPLGNLWQSYSTSLYKCRWGGTFQRTDSDHFSVEDDGVS